MININYGVLLQGNVRTGNAFSISGKLNTGSGISLNGNLLVSTVDRQASHYTGPVTVTPTQSTQTLATAGLKVDSNITINPIPSNYGKITWNGSYLKVS